MGIEKEYWYVEVLSRVDHSFLRDVRCEDYDNAVMVKDQIDLELDNSIYTCITSDFEECDNDE